MPTQLDLLKRDWVERSLPKLVDALLPRPFCCDDIHPILDKPDHPNWFGVLMSVAKRKGLIRRVGYQPSKRLSANRRVLATWERV